MLMSNLAVLLAARQLRISKVSTETKISRTTLTALSQNDFKGVQVDTMNTLCQYLGIDTGELFDFVPFDLELSVDVEPPQVRGLMQTKDTVITDSIVIEPFDQDAYLSKSSINESSGRIKRTFDLTVRMPTAVTIYKDNDRSDDPIAIPIQIFLGHSTDHDTFEKQHDEFSHIWNEELNASFRSFVANDMYLKIKDRLSNRIKQAIRQSANVEPDWTRLHYDFSLRFTDAFVSDKIGPLSITVNESEFPF